MYTFIVHTEPKTKKNSRPIYRNQSTGKTFIGKSKALADAESITQISLIEQSKRIQSIENGEFKNPFPLTQKLFSHIVFYKSTKRRCDMSNLVELINDCMQSVGIIGNDDQFVFTITEKYVDKNDPRTEITLGDIAETKLYMDLYIHPENLIKKHYYAK